MDFIYELNEWQRIFVCVSLVMWTAGSITTKLSEFKLDRDNLATAWGEVAVQAPGTGEPAGAADVFSTLILLLALIAIPLMSIM